MRHRQRKWSASTSRAEGKIRAGESYIHTGWREELSAIRRWQKFIMVLCMKSKNRYFCTVLQRKKSQILLTFPFERVSIIHLMSPINWNSSLYVSLFVSEALQRTIETFGTLDIVVNNAGIFDDVQWEKEVDVNLVGHRYLYRANIHICLRTNGRG